MPREVNWNIAKRRKPLREMAECGQKDLALAFEKLKARIRARVERPFHVVENIFRIFGAYFSSPHRRAANLATAHPSSESSYRMINLSCAMPPHSPLRPGNLGSSGAHAAPEMSCR